MIPVSLSISNFLSHLQSTEIDFTSFDLVCISGQYRSGHVKYFNLVLLNVEGEGVDKQHLKNS